MEKISTKRRVIYDNEIIYYNLEIKNVKNINLRINRNGEVFVSANSFVDIEYIDNFVLSNGKYIIDSVKQFNELLQYKLKEKEYVSGETFCILGRKQRLKVIQGNIDDVLSDGVYIYLTTKNIHDYKKKKTIMKKYLDLQCKSVFQEILINIYPIFQKYGVNIPELRIRDMKTRWGSCISNKGIIILNKRLLEAPRYCIEYVVVHELCHFIHPNHSKSFYNFMTMIMPDWKERKIILDKTARYWL